MPDPNEPRLLTPRGAGKEARVLDHVTGDAGRDGFTRIARHRRPERPDFPDMPAMPGQIDPHVGRRDYLRGPRFEEDF